MTELAETGLIFVGLVLLLVAIGWTGSGPNSALLRWRVKRIIAVVLVLALIGYFAVGIVMETVN